MILGFFGGGWLQDEPKSVVSAEFGYWILDLGRKPKIQNPVSYDSNALLLIFHAISF